MQAWRAKLVAQRLRQGAVIAYPTEGVWGLGCDPYQLEPVSRILEIKGRAWTQGLILAAGKIEQVESFLGGLTDDERAALQATWPGPVTFLVPDTTAPEWIRGQHETVALRVSAHPVIAAICHEFGGPIVSTSANPSGKPPATTALRLRQYFHDSLDYVVPGELGGARGATEIRELRGGKLVRSGKGR